MNKKISRREMMKKAGVAAGAAGAASLLSVPLVGAQPVQTGQSGQTAQASQGGQAGQSAQEKATLEKILSESSKTLLAEHEEYFVTLTAGDMVAIFDKRYGSLRSITRNGDAFATNYIGNDQNTPGVDPSDSLWTGDIVSTVWRLLGDWQNARLGQNDIFKMSGRWQREFTGKSADIRQVKYDGNSFHVNYAGQSRDDEAVRSYHVAMTFSAGEGSSVLWDIEIENVTGNVLEIGELGFPLMVNDDYAELYYEPGGPEGISGGGNVAFSLTPLRQKLIHEQKVLVHHFIAGHSSYALVQRPLGDAPFLLVHPTGDTSFECIYKEPASKFAAHAQGWRGPDILAIHSRATKDLRRWGSNPWVNGHSSLLLQPGQKKNYQIRFAFVDGYEAIREEIYKAGNMGIRVAPSMVVQEETDALVELKSKDEIQKIKFLSDNIRVVDKKRDGEKTLLKLQFKGRGQKSLKLHYGDGRWTNLHFYCVEDIESLLKARGKFVVDREFYQDPEDPYHRYHGFLPFDHRIGSTFLDSEEVWEVGGSDESGFSEPLFLAEKNVYFPSQKEVDTMETYVADCLFKYIQNPETYEVRASLYWKDRLPSSPWGNWTEERSKATFRTYNYVHPANIYHALYRIGKRYGLLTRKKPEEYLRMSYRTCIQWFQTGPWKHIGMMEGSNAIHILADIEREGWKDEAAKLREAMKECDEQFVEDPYPYSSELIIDQTAHEQVYFFTKFFGNTEKNKKTMQVLKALRGGNQPVWFRYGNDKRGDIACWYNASLNGLALLDAYEHTGDPDSLLKGYAGVMSVMHNVLPDGMGFNHFICTAGVFDNEPPRTFESGSGLWGFMQAAKSFVVRDESFGLVGYGCRVETTGNEISVWPKDGLRKRVRFMGDNVDLEVTQGEIDKISFDTAKKLLELSISDSTGLVKTAAVAIRGLGKGTYSISRGKSPRATDADGTLTIEVPMQEAKAVRIQKRQA
ncbi:MAG TPA: DUF5695 domain-containing protein [Candidatus Acidoferrales bacterium]|nr:DUF5695 domain-containing protein [Candidatus Acidoferrales bacterium]